MRTAGSETGIAAGAALPAARGTSRSGALLLLAKPGIVLAESAAGFVGILLSFGAFPPFVATVCCLFALIMAVSGAAMVNCVLEAKADRLMPRLATRSRALATFGPVRLLTVGLLLMAAAFALTALLLNALTLLLLAVACSSYLLLYTRWLKYSSPWGVLAGAIPGALPPLIGAAAVSGSLSARPLLLGAIIFLWQLPHFWFLALQYREQYRQAGIPVVPLIYGDDLTKRLTLLSAVSLFPVTLSFHLLGSFSLTFTLATLLAGVTFPLCCYRYLFLTAEYRKGFIVSLSYLAIILVAVITDILLAANA